MCLAGAHGAFVMCLMRPHGGTCTYLNLRLGTSAAGAWRGSTPFPHRAVGHFSNGSSIGFGRQGRVWGASGFGAAAVGCLEYPTGLDWRGSACTGECLSWLPWVLLSDGSNRVFSYLGSYLSLGFIFLMPGQPTGFHRMGSAGTGESIVSLLSLCPS
jgi:hypothetical protein